MVRVIVSIRVSVSVMVMVSVSVGVSVSLGLGQQPVQTVRSCLSRHFDHFRSRSPSTVEDREGGTQTERVHILSPTRIDRHRSAAPMSSVLVSIQWLFCQPATTQLSDRLRLRLNHVSECRED
ncbi:unnamed protein product, partial [Protopolystoma xenopodis]